MTSKSSGKLSYIYIINTIKKSIIPATWSDQILGAIGIISMALFLFATFTTVKPAKMVMVWPWLIIDVFVFLWLLSSLIYKVILFFGLNIRILGLFTIAAFVTTFLLAILLISIIEPSIRTPFYETVGMISFVVFMSIDVILPIPWSKINAW